MEKRSGWRSLGEKILLSIAKPPIKKPLFFGKKRPAIGNKPLNKAMLTPSLGWRVIAMEQRMIGLFIGAKRLPNRAMLQHNIIWEVTMDMESVWYRISGNSVSGLKKPLKMANLLRGRFLRKFIGHDEIIKRLWSGI